MSQAATGTSETPGRAPSTASRVAVAKDVFSLIRDVLIGAAVFLLLVFPSTFNTVLSNAGFEEGSFAGLKWKRSFFDTDRALQTAQNTITQLQQDRDRLSEALKQQAVTASDPKKREEIANIQTKSEQIGQAAQQVQTSVNATLAANVPLIEKARVAIASDPLPQVAYCYQEDNLQPNSDKRFSVHCHVDMPRCEAARGPNLRTKQSLCERVETRGVQWSPLHPGWMGSWYEFRKEPFGGSFPQIPR